MVRGLWMAFCVIALSDAIQSDNPQKRIETQQRKLLTGPEDSLNFVGTNVIFTCQSTLRSCVKLTWYKELPIFLWSQSDKIPDTCPLEKGRCIVENTTSGCRLTFTNVQLKDAGNFYCKLEIGDQSFEGRIARLTVTTQANALKGPSDKFAPTDYVVIFTCLSPLEGCIGMNWYKDTPGTDKVAIFGEADSFFFDTRPKYIVENSTLGCRLTITDVKLVDTGSVYCRISVSGRLIERSAVLLVLDPKGNPLRGPEDVLFFVGANAVFTCESTLRSCAKLTWYKELPTFFWTDSIDISDKKCQLEKGRCIVEKTASGCRLTLTNVQLSDVGRFYCKLDVGGQSFPGRTAKLIVTRQADALRGPSDSLSTVGQYASFTCLSAFGDCRGMSWYKDTPGTDRVAVFSEGSGIYLRDKYSVANSTLGCQLTIKNLELRDTGSVYCQIQISGTEVEKWATQLVFEGRIENPLKGPDDSVNFINTTAVFTCTSPLRSCVKINWYRGTEMIRPMLNDPYSHLRERYVFENTTMGCRLIIGSVRVNDAGYFICEIVLGRTSFKGRTAHLTVIDTAQPCELDISLLRLSDNFSTPGYDVSFTCVSPLKSCVGINWYKDVPRYYRRPIFSDGKVIYLEDKHIVENSTSGCELFIKRAEDKDAGVVVCEMVISQRPYEAAAFLHVFETKSQKISLNFVDTNATFTCDSPLGDCANMIWYIDDLPSIFGPPEFVPVYDVDSTVRDRWTVQKTSSGCKLTLINVQLTDAGHVYCEIMLGGRPFRGETTNFTVFSRRRQDETEDYDYEEKDPTTKEPGRRKPDETEDYDYEEEDRTSEEQDEDDALEGLVDFYTAPGEDATFTCLSPLRNCIEMVWYKEQLRTNRVVIFDPHTGIYLRDKYIVENSIDGCQLTVKNVERADAGTFHCQIVISQRTHTRSAILFIDGVSNHEPIG